MRKLNLRFFCCLFGGLAFFSTALAVAHHLQYRRISPALLRQADKAQEAGDLERTDQFLSRYLEFNPDDIEQRARLAKLLADPKLMRTRGAERRAYEQLEFVLARDPGRHELRRLVVPLAMRLDRPKEVAGHLEALQQAYPNDGSVAALWGQFYESQKQTDLAVASYRDAVKYSPTVIDNYKNLARLIRAQRFETLNGEAQVKRRKEAVREADDVIVNMVKANPEAWEARVARWVYLRDHYVVEVKQKDSALAQEAEKDVSQALVLPGGEGQPEVRLAAAELAQLHDKFGEAREHLDKAFQLHPNDPRVYRGYAQVELSEKWATSSDAEKDAARGKAYDWLRKGVKDLRGQNQFDVMWAFATLLMDRGTAEDLNEADKVIAAIRKTNISPAGADFLRARLLFGRQQWSDAAREFERVRTQMENVRDLLTSIDLHLARCYGQLENRQSQFGAYSRLAQREPDNLAAHLGMAQASEAMGHHAEAATHYRKAAAMENAPASAAYSTVRLMIREAKQKKNGPTWKEVEQAIDELEKAPKSDKVAVIILRAEYLVARNEAPKADALLEQAQRDFPARVEPWIARSMLAQEMRDPDKAGKILDEAEQTFNKPGSKAKDGDKVDLLLERARYWEQRANGQTKDKLKEIGQAIATFSGAEQDQLLNGLATCQFRAGNPDEAARLWDVLAQHDDYRADLRLRLMLFNLAVQQGLQDRMDDVIKAIRTIENGDGIYGKQAQALRLIWLAQQGKLGEKEKATALDQASELLSWVDAKNPGLPAVIVARAEIEETKGNPARVVTYYQEAIKQGERSPLVLRKLVTTLEKLGRQKEAGDVIKQMLQEEIAAGDLGKIASVIVMRNGDPGQAMKIAQETVKKDSRDYRDYVFLGVMQGKTRQLDADAEKNLRRALELGGGEMEPWLALTEFLVQRDRAKDAEALLKDIPLRVAAENRALTLACCYTLFGQPKEKEAQEQFQSALKDKPNDPRVLKEYASFHLQRNDFAAAEALLRKTIDVTKDKDDVEWAATRLAVLLSAAGDWEKFKESLSFVGLRLDGSGKVVADKGRVASDSLEMQRTRARVLATQPMNKIREEAIVRFEELGTSSLTPDDMFILARLYESKGVWPKARVQFMQLSLMQQVRVSHLTYYIQGLLRQGELSSARQQLGKLEAAVKAQPTPQGKLALVELQARELEALKQEDKAITLLKDRLRQRESDPQEILLLVSALGRQKKFGDALTLLDEVWRNCPEETAGGTSVALLRATTGHDAERKTVETRLRTAIEKNPKSSVLWVQLGDLEDLRGEYEEAEKCYRKALEINEREQMALNNLAWLLATRQRKTDEALALINKAIGAAGPRSELLDTRAVVYLTMGRNPEAVADLTEAIAENATPTRYFHLARVQHQANNRDAAAKAMREARRLGLNAAQLHPVEQVAFSKMTDEFKAE